MRAKLVAFVVLLVVGLGAIGYAVLGFGAGPTTSTQYLTARAETQDVIDEVVATGTLSAASSYALAFGSAPVESDASGSTSGDASATGSSGATSVDWTVTSVEVAVGDRVTKDEALAQASSSDLDSQVADASRAVESARLQVKVAQAAVDDATTTAQKRQAKISLYSAQTQLAQSKATLADLKAMRPWATLAAPADGVVTSVAVQPGSQAPSATAITIDAAGLQVVGGIVESDLPKVAVGQPASITIEALGVDVPGTVSAVAPSATASNGAGSSVVTFAVTVNLQDPPESARAGMSAQVAITVARASNVLAVPVAAIGGSAGSYEVRVLAADGSVVTRPVSVGLITSSLAEIESGLAAGETVITGTSSPRTNAGTGFFGGGAGGGQVRAPDGQP